MALANKKSSDIFNKNTGGSKNSKSITDAIELEIKNKFDNGEHVEDNGMFETLAPALYAIQQLTEDIEEIRRFVTSEITSITTSQANAITANTSKTTFPGFGTSSTTALRGDTTTISTSQASAITANTAKVSQGLTTANMAMQFSVARKGGQYTLLVTILDSSGSGKPVIKTGQITLS